MRISPYVYVIQVIRRGLTLEQVFVLPPPVWQIDQCNWGVILTLGV